MTYIMQLIIYVYFSGMYNMYLHVFVCVCLFVCVCVCVCSHGEDSVVIKACTYIHMYIHTCM